MKTITKNNKSLYLFEDAEYLNINNQNIVVGNPEVLIISDCNLTNVVLHENVEPPEDWIGCKYFFDGTAWTLNPDYI